MSNNRNKSIKQSLKHINDVYYIFHNKYLDKENINDLIILELQKYLLDKYIYTEDEIKEAKDLYERNKIYRNETEGYKTFKREDLGEEWQKVSNS